MEISRRGHMVDRGGGSDIQVIDNPGFFCRCRHPLPHGGQGENRVDIGVGLGRQRDSLPAAQAHADGCIHGIRNGEMAKQEGAAGPESDAAIGPEGLDTGDIARCRFYPFRHIMHMAQIEKQVAAQIHKS